MARPLRYGEKTRVLRARLPESKMRVLEAVASDAGLTTSAAMVHILQGVAEGDAVDQVKVAELREVLNSQGSYIRQQERLRIALQERLQRAERRLGAYKAKFIVVMSRLNRKGIEAAKRTLRAMEREVADLQEIGQALNVGEIEADAAIRRLRTATVEVPA